MASPLRLQPAVCSTFAPATPPSPFAAPSPPLPLLPHTLAPPVVWPTPLAPTPRRRRSAAELLLLELLRWRLHVVTPHSYVPVLIDGTDHTGYTAAEVRKHSDFFVDLASFELLAFEYTGGAIAAAAVYCALWRLKLVDSVEPAALQAMPPSSRLSQLVAAAGGEGTATLADAATCVDRMVKALHALEADHARIAKEKERKQREKEEADRAAADAAQEAADAARERAAAGAAGAEEAPLSPSAAACHEVQELHTCDASFAPVNTALEVSERADSPDSIIPGVAGAAAGAKAAAAPAPSAAAAGKRARAASAADEGGERKKAAAARR